MTRRHFRGGSRLGAAPFFALSQSPRLSRQAW